MISGSFKYILILSVYCIFVESFETSGVADYRTRVRRGGLSILRGSSAGKSTPQDSCYCAKNDKPVCGNDRVTYPNPCKFKCAFEKKPKLRVVHQGAC